MDILKIVLVSAVCTVFCLVLKQFKPEIVPFLQIASILLIFSLAYDGAKQLLGEVTELISESGVVYDEYTYLLMRVLGIALITKIGAELCRDSGNSVLAVIVEFAGKLTILLLCFSLLKTVVGLASGLLR
ncbi:MAG: hypothetical protein IK955_06345 [Clostridia bacterium]|nr:hypothetical protein [Clostridia bacterium]